ncbi:MAG: hypothetical protein Q8O37_05430 [Sulfuricellaceae bacterium]|nr:hypothetical protein [Sulfuricellaceae bacterium]
MVLNCEVCQLAGFHVGAKPGGTVAIIDRARLIACARPTARHAACFWRVAGSSRRCKPPAGLRLRGLTPWCFPPPPQAL